MKKFNYQITIDAPGREIADFIMKLICNENEGLITDVKAEKTPEEREAIERKQALEALEILEGIVDLFKENLLVKFEKENKQQEKTETKQ